MWKLILLALAVGLLGCDAEPAEQRPSQASEMHKRALEWTAGLEKQVAENDVRRSDVRRLQFSLKALIGQFQAEKKATDEQLEAIEECRMQLVWIGAGAPMKEIDPKPLGEVLPTLRYALEALK